jgi:golgi reassembly-stacking protein
MGGQESTLRGDEDGSPASQDVPEFAFQVLMVQPHSPSAGCGLRAYRDFITHIDGAELFPGDLGLVSGCMAAAADFADGKVAQPQPDEAAPSASPAGAPPAEGVDGAEPSRPPVQPPAQRSLPPATKPSVTLRVFDARDGIFRVVEMNPRHNWGGRGCAGCSIRGNVVRNAVELVYHVLSVRSKAAPAALAGLAGNGTDYIIGAVDAIFRDEGDFFALVEHKEQVQEPMGLYVYNTVTDDVRLVELVPRRGWGSDAPPLPGQPPIAVGEEGALGCDVGFGLLHRVPVKTHASAIKQELRDDEDDMLGDANMLGDDVLGGDLAAASEVPAPSPVESTAAQVTTPPAEIPSSGAFAGIAARDEVEDLQTGPVANASPSLLPVDRSPAPVQSASLLPQEAHDTAVPVQAAGPPSPQAQTAVPERESPRSPEGANVGVVAPLRPTEPEFKSEPAPAPSPAPAVATPAPATPVAQQPRSPLALPEHFKAPEQKLGSPLVDSFTHVFPVGEEEGDFEPMAMATAEAVEELR